LYTGHGDSEHTDETSMPAAVWGSGLVVDRGFAEAHVAFVRRTLLRLGVAGSDLDDGIQEVFLAAVTGAQRFELGRSERAWLYGIAVNVARVQRRRRHRFGYTFAEPPEVSVPPTQERGMERSEARSFIHRALDDLPEEQRDVVVLYRLEGWSMDEVAEAVGCAVPTAHSRLRLGTARLSRAVRRSVVRGRWAALVAAVASALGWPPAAAAATATAMLVVATWATVATLGDAEDAIGDTPPGDGVASATVGPSPALHAPTPSQPPEPVDVARPAEAPAAPEQDTRHAPRSASLGRAVPPPPPIDDSRTAPVVEPAPTEELVTSNHVLEETQLLRRARTVVESSPTAALELLQRYDARFPNGQLRQERDAIAALLAQ
jgi:RNA polymerase sigma-70 factor (ECF subfamily)